jgi:DNA-binding GntR family transcriptional regulator
MISIDERNVAEVLRYNREFHFRIFDLSPLGQVRKEVGRLWQMSDIYSAAWWRRQPEAKKRINTEHKAIISALRRFDLDKLVEICALHRTGGLERAATGVPPTVNR